MAMVSCGWTRMGPSEGEKFVLCIVLCYIKFESEQRLQNPNSSIGWAAGLGPIIITAYSQVAVLLLLCI